MAKKKIKKLLKGLGIGAALLGAGKALMNARDRKAMINSATADDGFGFMTMKDFGPYSKRSGIIPKRRLMNANELSNDLSEYDASQPFGFGLMAKKGGRIVKGKKAAVRTKGFGKKKKQANRSKKK